MPRYTYRAFRHRQNYEDRTDYPSKGTCTVSTANCPPQHQGTGLTVRIPPFRDKISRAIQQITGQEYVDEYAQVVKKQMAAEAAQKAADQARRMPVLLRLKHQPNRNWDTCRTDCGPGCPHKDIHKICYHEKSDTVSTISWGFRCPLL